MTDFSVKAPFPYFGGKSRAAAAVWSASPSSSSWRWCCACGRAVPSSDCTLRQLDGNSDSDARLPAPIAVGKIEGRR